MLTTRPYLNTFRPSPSTVSYTVSTASPRQTFPSQLLHHCILLLRILLGFATITILGAKFFNNPPLPLLAPLSVYLETFSWLQIAPLAFTSLFFVFRRFHTGELFEFQYAPPSLFLVTLLLNSDSAIRFTSQLTVSFDLIEQKNPSSPSAPSASKLPPSPPPTSSPATRASSPPRRSATSSSMRRFVGLK